MQAVATIREQPHPIERDAEGLQLAARELFEECFFEESMKSILTKIEGEDEVSVAMRGRILADKPPRTLAMGYYVRIAYVMELGASIEAGAQYSAASLMRDEVIGLQAVKRAKSEFERDHPSCGGCGARQDNRFMRECKKCRMKFAGRGD